jgi:hypothetical protein
VDAEKFRQDRTIDPGQLDVECVRQADAFFDWSELAVKARGKADRLKLRLETTQAALELECREKPENFGLKKVTEAAVKAAVLCSERYLESSNEYFDAKEESALLDAAVKAMDQKESMLKELIKLHGQQYFAGPSVPRDLVSNWRDIQAKREERVNSRQAERVRRKKKRKRIHTNEEE